MNRNGGVNPAHAAELAVVGPGEREKGEAVGDKAASSRKGEGRQSRRGVIGVYASKKRQRMGNVGGISGSG